MAERAVFLDRDGTINEEIGYLKDPETIRLLPGSGEAVRKLRQAGWRVIVVTNQSGISRGYIDHDILSEIHARLVAQLGDHFTEVDDILYCPHHPEESCRCRKPETELIDLAQARFGLDLSASWMVGDKHTDVELGKRIGSHTALVLTGYGAEHVNMLAEKPDMIANDLAAVVRHILREED